MTIASTLSSARYAGNGETREFPLPFRFLASADVAVVLRAADGSERVQAEGTQYEITGAGLPQGGTCRLATPPAAGEVLSLTRAPRLVQETDYQENDAFPAETHEAALDQLTMICQALDEKIARAPLVKVSAAARGLSLGDPAPGRALVWGAGGLALEPGPEAGDIALAQGYAAQAAQSVTRAETARDASQAARQRAEAARDEAAVLATSLDPVTLARKTDLSAVETGLMSLAMKQAVQAGDTDRSILMNGWLDPLTDAGQVTLTGMEFQSGDTGYIQPTPAGSGVDVQNIVYAGQRGTNLKGSITTFTVDTANTSGHFDAPAHTGICSGVYIFAQKDGGNFFPAITSMTGDGTAANSVAFVATLPVGVYSVYGIFALATLATVGTFLWQINVAVGHPVNYAYAFDLPPFDSTYWTAITGASADAWTSRNPGGQVFGAVSFDGGTNYVMWNGSGWRGIVRSNAGTWQYYNPGTSQWVNATINDRLVAFSEAIAVGSNYWSLTPYYGLYTTDILTGGVVTASCANPVGSEANLVDGSTSTAWGSIAISAALPAWVKYQLPSAKRAWKYRLNVTTNPAYSPHDWQFQGSNDNTNWTTLDTQSGQTWAAAGWKEYSIPEANRGSYLYYRLYITAGGQETNNYMWIDEWEVYEEVVVTTSLPNITQAQWAQSSGFQAGTTTDVRFMAALRTTDGALAPWVKSLTLNVNRTTANGTAEFNAFAAVDPDIGRAVFVMQAVDDITLDTDLKAWMRRGTGAYAQVPLVQDSAYDATRVLVRGELDMSATPGTGTMFKLTTHNNKAVRVFQAANYFKSK